MSANHRIPSPSGLYHAMMRGVNRTDLFVDDQDREFFLEHARETAERTGARVLAFALMGNHVHFLIEADPDQLSAFFRLLGGRYARRFNLRHQRVGHLFQGRFKSIPVNDIKYLATVVAYIHLNPVRGGLASDPADYQWSSRGVSRHGARLADVKRLAEWVPLETLRRVEKAFLAADQAATDPFAPPPMGRPPKPADDAARALRSVCGVSDPAAFGALAPAEQSRTVAELGDLGLSQREIARVVGWTRHAVRVTLG
ncbi:MAG: transposase [Bifidobacteriaceae bacterium]|jgi:REP element-mobilizing transposase RayT|nr:transposase [Bifidobacteriaceae bacterium]